MHLNAYSGSLAVIKFRTVLTHFRNMCVDEMSSVGSMPSGEKQKVFTDSVEP